MNQNIVILGGGESGTGAAILAKDKGERVFLSDTGRLAPGYAGMLESEGIEYECGHPHTTGRVLAADLIIKSPGIPYTAPVVAEAIRKGIPVISEIEYAGRFTSSRMVCITGSNGKTTTTTLLHHILTSAGMDASMAGNVGDSLALQVARSPHDIYVVELSSFQLDGMYDFRADIGILMNITPDHLDRYEHSMNLYAASKMRITRNQRPSDSFIYWQQDPVTLSHLHLNAGNARKLTFAENRSGQETGDCAAWLEGGTMKISTPGGSWEMPRAELSLKGLHNLYNSMAAAIAATTLGVEPGVIRRALSDFKAVEHRMEKVAEIQGVEYINDSKATNVASTFYALESMTRPTVLILGGTDKGNDYTDILAFMKEKVHTVVAMGLDNAKIVGFCREHGFPVRDTHSLGDALEACRLAARPGDTVLLSPCCASFDLFKSYIDRGDQFKSAVLNMK